MMETDRLWLQPASHPVLRPDQVHLWKLSLRAGPEALDACSGLLSTDERAQRDRFHFARDRRRYAVARATLRSLLAAYLRTDSRSLDFTYGPQGKPFLPAADISFNLSHAGELALFAVCLDGRVGVDIEERRPLNDLHSLAATVFSESELAALASLPPNQQTRAFYDCWTRKEAFIKAIGEGLSYPLSHFDVSLLPGEEARLLRIDGQESPQLRWQMAAFSPANGYSGALVVERPGRTLSFWRWE